MSNELMTTSAGGLSLISRIAEFQTVAKLFADSGMFSDARGAAQCDDRVSVRFKRMTAAVNAAIAHDQQAPHAEAQPA